MLTFYLVQVIAYWEDMGAQINSTYKLQQNRAGVVYFVFVSLFSSTKSKLTVIYSIYQTKTPPKMSVKWHT